MAGKIEDKKDTPETAPPQPNCDAQVLMSGGWKQAEDGRWTHLKSFDYRDGQGQHCHATSGVPHTTAEALAIEATRKK